MRLLSVVLILSLATAAPAREPDKELVAGVAAVTAKDYSSAIGILSQVVRRLASVPASEDDLVSAYVHMGVAFAGLGQESPARSQFAQALLRKPTLTFDVSGAPDLARKLFAEAQRDAAPAIAASAQQKKKSSKVPLIAAGVVAAAAAGAAVAGGGGSSDGKTSPPPTFSANLQPTRLFNFAGISGSPYLFLVSGEPASGSTLSVGSARPRFLLH
ncbi:MAG TPA: hypothetical protein VMV21_02065, partial [Vicinamibacteria bacterium]|nr:hypothetical protein [Vicinamibacteria bacterium]